MFPRPGRAFAPLLSLAPPTLLMLACATPVSAQRVLDWPVRIDAQPDALVGGAAAVFWNPARAGAHDGDVEVLVVDLATPDALSLGAVGVAATARLFGHFSVAAGYQHTSVGDMVRTDGPPLEEPADRAEFEIGEDVFALGLAAVTPRGWTLGAAARWLRASPELGGGSTWQGTIGAQYAARIPPGDVRVAGMGTVASERLELGGAIEFVAHLPESTIEPALAWGIAERQSIGVAHRLVARGVWRRLLEAQLGMTAEPGAAGHTWEPVLAAMLHLGRYTVGVVREQLPNDFGGVMHYRLGVEF